MPFLFAKLCAHSTDGTRRRVHSPSMATSSIVVSVTAVRGSMNPSIPLRADDPLLEVLGIGRLRSTQVPGFVASAPQNPIRTASRFGQAAPSMTPRSAECMVKYRLSDRPQPPSPGCHLAPVQGWLDPLELTPGGPRSRRFAEADRGGHNATRFDIVILGGGSGGYACALRASELGTERRAWSRRTSSAAPACTAAASRPRRCCTPARWPTPSASRDSSASRRRWTGVDLAGVNAYKDGVVGRLYKGLQGLVKSRGITVIEGHGTLVAAERGRRRRHPLRGARTSSWPPAPTPSRCRASTSTASGSSAVWEALQLETLPKPRDRARRRRDRRRVRRRPGARSAPRSPSSRRCRGWCRPKTPPARRPWSARSASAASPSRPRHSFAVVEKTDAGVRVTRRVAATRTTPTCCSSRSAVARNTADLGYEAQGIAMERGFVLTDERLRTNVAGRLRRRRHRARAAARAPRLPAGHLRGRGDRRARARPDRRGRHPAGHLLRARGRLCRAQRGQAAQTAYGDDAVETLTYDLGGNGKSQILKTQGFVKLVRAQGRPGRRHAHGRRSGGRADRRGPADLQLGGVPRGRRVAGPHASRPRTKRWARPTWRWPANRSTRTPEIVVG